jgi:hypothetical protein
MVFSRIRRLCQMSRVTWKRSRHRFDYSFGSLDEKPLRVVRANDAPYRKRLCKPHGNRVNERCGRPRNKREDRQKITGALW